MQYLMFKLKLAGQHEKHVPVDDMKHQYNPNDKLSSVQMIKKLNEIKPKKGEDLKMMCDKIEALKVKYWDQAEIINNDTIVMHLFLVCPKLYK